MDGADIGALRYPWTEPPAPGQAVEVADGVLWMRLPLPMKLDHVNIYALDDGDGWSVIDTGFDSRRSREAWHALLAGPLAGRPVRRVIVTHHHPDHVGLAGWFQREHGAELVMTRTGWLFARMLTLDVQEKWPEETLAFYRGAGMEREFYARRAKDRPFNFADVVAPMPLGFTRVKQDDRIRIGGRNWVVHTGGGHAPEQATFWSMDDNLVLTGDQVISTISPNIGVYATEPLADPLSEWLESCARLSRHARPDHLALAGHKLPFTGLPHRLRALVENHESALARLLEYLDRPRSAGDCFQPLFRRSIGTAEYGHALVESVAHLNHLYHKGLVTRVADPETGAWMFRRSDQD
ncbi:MBL fold metallo-hydrolase [Pontibaca methylaminivorans]|uniref:MBL fold metallo-hydrolase n=1 Tax=Pontibaca methylaminivorans TaxID=515897 RepID=UPI002FD977AA